MSTLSQDIESQLDATVGSFDNTNNVSGSNLYKPRVILSLTFDLVTSKPKFKKKPRNQN